MLETQYNIVFRSSAPRHEYRPVTVAGLTPSLVLTHIGQGSFNGVPYFKLFGNSTKSFVAILARNS
jgi:hypothetical protein